MMARKPKRRIQFMQLESGMRTLIFIGMCIVFIGKFDTTALSFRGILLAYIILFGGMYTYLSSFQFYRILGKVDFSKSIQENRVLFEQLENNKALLKKVNVGSYIVGSLIFAYLFISKWEVILMAGPAFLVPITVVGIGAIVFSIIRSRAIQRQLRKLKDEMDELNRN